MSEMISNNFQDQLEEEINNIKENIKNLETRVKGIKMIFWIQMTIQILQINRIGR